MFLQAFPALTLYVQCCGSENYNLAGVIRFILKSFNIRPTLFNCLQNFLVWNKAFELKSGPQYTACLETIKPSYSVVLSPLPKQERTQKLNLEFVATERHVLDESDVQMLKWIAHRKKI